MESSLTTGRYDDALARARALLAGQPPLEPSEHLNVTFFVAASLLLKGDVASGQAALDEVNAAYQKLPSGFENTWSYAGTITYIQHAQVSPTVKSLLIDTLGTIRSKA